MRWLTFSEFEKQRRGKEEANQKCVELTLDLLVFPSLSAFSKGEL